MATKTQWWVIWTWKARKKHGRPLTYSIRNYGFIIVVSEQKSFDLLLAQLTRSGHSAMPDRHKVLKNTIRHQGTRSETSSYCRTLEWWCSKNFPGKKNFTCHEQWLFCCPLSRGRGPWAPFQRCIERTWQIILFLSNFQWCCHRSQVGPRFDKNRMSETSSFCRTLE